VSVPSSRKFYSIFSKRLFDNVESVNFMSASKRSKEIDRVCIKCGRDIAVHPSTGRFHSIVLTGHECAWNPDEEFKNFVLNTLRSSGYDIGDFGHLT
jgi:hypothetical protein